MTAPATILAQAAFSVVFGLVARNRARAFGVPVSPTAAMVLLASFAVTPCLLMADAANRTIPAIALTACSAISAVTDLQTGLIFDRVLAIALLLMIPFVVSQGAIGAGVGGAAAAAGLLGLPYALSRGRSMGLGDVKLAAVIGFAMGPANALRALCIASIAGGAVAAVLMSSRQAGRKETLAFGPFLAAGAALVIAGVH